MTGTFACPECGDEVTLKGATPGREVQCSRCATWVEVPYLPRDGVWTRPRYRKARRPWLIPLGWAGVALLALAIAFVAGSKYIESRGRSSREATLAEFIRTADQAEKLGRVDRALSEIEGALAYLRQGDRRASDRLADLRRRRDSLSIREAESRIVSAAKQEPDAAVGQLLTLQARARTDRTLDGLTTTILAAIDAARRRQVEADFAAARRARDEGRPFDALTLGERALGVADKLDANTARSAMAESDSILGPIVARMGVIVVQLPGTYSVGSVEAYDKTLAPILVDVLRRKGYVPKPPKGSARTIWDQHAPYRCEFRVAEAQGMFYLQSKNRVSEITANLSLLKGREAFWQVVMSGRTQVPLPDLSAYVGSRIAVSERRNPDVERMLYDNARASLMEQLGATVRGMPPL